MSSMRHTIKHNARAVLSGSLFKAVLVLLLIAFLSVALSSLEYAFRKALGFPDQPFVLTKTKMIITQHSLLRFASTTMALSGVFSVLSFLLLTPLALGQTEWYWRLTDRKPQGVEGVFAWLGSLRLYGKSLWLNFNVFLRLLPLGLVTVGLPYALMFSSVVYLGISREKDYSVAACLIFGGFVLLLCGVFLLALFGMRYMLAQYLLVEDNSRTARECIRASVRYSRGRRIQMVAFLLSFSLWFLAGVMLAMIPLLWVLPYYYASFAIYAKYLIYSGRDRERREGAGIRAETAV